MRIARAIAAAIAVAAAWPASAGATAPTAVVQFQAYQTALQTAAKAQDWDGYLATAKALKVFLHDGPTARLEVARAYLHLADKAAARAETQRFLALGETNPVLKSEAFAVLRPGLDAEIAANQAPAGAAATVFRLDEPQSLPEDIDYDPVSKRFFIAQVLGKAIVSLDRSGAARAFARSPDDWPFAALKIDRARRRLWVTEVAFDGFAAAPKSAWGRSAVLVYDLDSGHLRHRVEGPARASLGDLALAPNGDPIVSDGDGGRLYRLRGGRFQRLDHGEFLSPQTVAFCGETEVAMVPDYVRGLARMDLRTGRVVWLSGAGHALDGIDGLYCRGRALVAVQNGATPMRVVRFQLNQAMTAVVAEQVLDRARPGLGDPTHGVIVGERFYYLGNVGWPELDAAGLFKPGPRDAPPAVMRSELTRWPVSGPPPHGARPKGCGR